MLAQRLALVALVALAGCKKHAADTKSDKPRGDKGNESYRTDTTGYHTDPAVVGSGKTFLVVSEGPLASKVGRDMLAAGGNAVDAAVATAFALAVVHPTAGNLAGGGFAVVHVAKDQDATLDFREVAPGAATETMFLDAAGKPTKASTIGDRAVGVPGTVAGLYALHQKYGKKPWKDVIAPAIAFARDGFAVDAYLHKAIEYKKDLLAASPASAALWLPGGKPREVGEVVKLPELQAALERIADKGADGFYTGPTAQAIVDEMTRGGGLITAKDLAGYKPDWRDPLTFDYRGRHVVTMPPPSSGGVVLEMTANMLRTVDLGKLGWHSAEHLHWLIEVWRRAFAARNELLGDPAYVKDMPLAKLTSQAYADQLASSIQPTKATPSKTIPGLIEGNHTTNLCVVDASGMAVAMTVTLNTAFGNGVTVDGFLLNDEMDDFTSKPGEPNTYALRQGAPNKIEPGKRMLSSMTPTLLEDDQGQVVMVVGAGGGPRIITAVWQTISNVVDFGLAVDAAVAAPRIHHQHLPDSVRVEGEAITREVDKKLRTMGYIMDFSQTPREFGAVTAIVRTQNGWQGAADPRGGGAAIGD
ncbi:MAG TPA: gamma-glutamyltransferase [Kofleriaceae bacterium]|nr:gamma-glutamyltransferase [Kofleriaceae bacterium]